MWMYEKRLQYPVNTAGPSVETYDIGGGSDLSEV